MSTVLYEQQDRIVTITINRPEAMNAVDPETQEALVSAWTRFRDDDSAWVAILTGAGERAFSAGADLKKLVPGLFARGGAAPHNADGLGGITRGLEIWKPMIAAINGFCLAGGLEQALACDLRIATPSATFGLTEVRWAIMPGAGGTQRLPRALPLAKALEMILMARTLTAEEALRWGLVNAVVPPAELLPTARRMGAITISGSRPTVISGRPKRASSEATTRSQPTARPQPPARAQPCTCAITGVRIRASRSRIRGRALNDSRASSVEPRSPAPLRSAPAQNALSPAPESTMTRAAGSASEAPSAASSSATIVRESALRTSGRFRVMRATPSWREVSSVS
ncbi:MAG: hypothetical protein A2W08_11515 [Candidatus Rokubacteria bacterium RBG_16_73_20]|nr:MAG: hypothetical protein A2W08_11515 [Candidatus Rokubacteria bacterium RBG_16_73_20]